MARAQRTEKTGAAHGKRASRHRKRVRSSITGPHLPVLHSRISLFERTVASTAEYLRNLWPQELSDVSFEVGTVPPEITGEALERWRVEGNTIVLYRLPIQRLSRLHKADALHHRMVIESCVFHAVAEFLGKDPWELIRPDKW